MISEPFILYKRTISGFKKNEKNSGKIFLTKPFLKTTPTPSRKTKIRQAGLGQAKIFWKKKFLDKPDFELSENFPKKNFLTNTFFGLSENFLEKTFLTNTFLD